MTQQANPEYEELKARNRFLMALLIDRSVLTHNRYAPGEWSLQGKYGVDDGGVRRSGKTPSEVIDNAMAETKLDPANSQTYWWETPPDPQALHPEYIPLPPGFTVDSDWSGRWHVPLAKVHEDYAAFLQEYDGISREEAMEKANDPDSLETWFCEQYIWNEVRRDGILLNPPTPEQAAEALANMETSSDSRPSDCFCGDV